MAVTQVYCRTRFIGFHRWPDAPNDVFYLRDFHRHEFHVELCVEVAHADRAVEFITLRRQLDHFIKTRHLGDPHDPTETARSCEMFAEIIVSYFQKLEYKVVHVDVSEDGENGARYIP